MSFRIVTLVAVVALLAAIPGCGDRVVVVQEIDPTLIEGEIGPGMADFEIVVPAAGLPGQVITGPFIIHGTNIWYDPGIGALTVDLTVTNASNKSYPLPVKLEFLSLLPQGLRILNPDNGIYGPGAMIEFSFTNRDMQWTPGETSIPRNVQFGIPEGVSIGFTARMHVGPDARLGSIYGAVFHDVNEDGIRQADEFGLFGRTIALAHADSMYDCIHTQNCNIIEYTTTGIEGEYSFHNLQAGFYVVSIMRDRCSNITTPAEIMVILVEDNGTVSDFFRADFGVSLIRNCCGIVNGHFADGEYGWVNRNEGPGLDAAVEEIVSVDGRDHVLHLDSRAGGNYYLFRTQITGSCGVLGSALSWEWMVDTENPYGLAAVWVEFIDGAHATVGRYFVRRHTGQFAAYSCDALVAEHLQTNPNMIVGCREIHATFAAWGYEQIEFSQAFFDALEGPDINPNTIAEIKVWIQSYNNAGAGADAYFDNFRYRVPFRPE